MDLSGPQKVPLLNLKAWDTAIGESCRFWIIPFSIYNYKIDICLSFQKKFRRVLDAWNLYTVHFDMVWAKAEETKF